MPCKNVNVEEPTPDTSTTNLNLGSFASPSPNEVVVNYGVSNNVTSGNGESLSPTVVVSIDGTLVNDKTYNLSPGQSVSENLTITDVNAGSRQICVEVQ